MEIESQAIEQPLDMTIPENKMMLAFYLAAPKEGRYSSCMSSRISPNSLLK